MSTDLLADLPGLSWRDILVPARHGTARFASGEAEHRYIYRDKQLIEATGLENWVFSYDIPFREGVAKGPYKHLFTDTLAKFLTACRDRTTGDLVDPVLGPFRAKCTSWSHDIDTALRDGVDVKVDFKYAPDDDATDEPVTINIHTATDESGALDKAVSKVNWGQEESPEPTIDPFLLADSLERMAEFEAGKFGAAMAGAAAKIDKTIAALDRLQDPMAWPVRQSAIRLKDAAVQLAMKVGSPGKKIGQVTLGAASTISALASQFGMTVGAFLALNPMLAMTPAVPPGTTVYFYVR
jgi:hypothetical protein